MAHDDTARREVRKAYIFERLALPTAALKGGVPESTVRRWKREARVEGDDWDALRAANTVAGEGLDTLTAHIVEDFVVQFQATIQGLKDDETMAAGERVKHMASLADAFNKVVGAAARISPKISELGVAMDVLHRLTRFVSARMPQHGPALVEILEPFASELSDTLR